jgi:hypothetical protein
MLDETRSPSPIRSHAIEMRGVYRLELFSREQRQAIDNALLDAVSDPTSFIVRNSALGALGQAIREDRRLRPADRERIHRAVIAAATKILRDVLSEVG